MGELVKKEKPRLDTSTIFDYIGSDDNEILTYLPRTDRQFLLQYISKYILDYRSSLGLSGLDTFGIEIEFDNADKGQINRKLHSSRLDYRWEIKPDNSLSHGGEIASPILSDSGTDWSQVEQVCGIVRPNAIINNNCGGHVHIGRQALGNDRQAWLNFLKLWTAYEKVIYRFGYGEYSTGRKGIDEYATPISIELFEDIAKLSQNNCSIDEIVTMLATNKYHGLNFKNIRTSENPDKIDTFEFRAPNGTLNEIIWQNNINLFIKMLKAAQSPDFSESVVMNRLRLIERGGFRVTEYDQLDMDAALEFADIVFDNNLDKVYFLRQYMKAMENGVGSLVETQPFTRIRK